MYEAPEPFRGAQNRLNSFNRFYRFKITCMHQCGYWIDVPIDWLTRRVIGSATLGHIGARLVCPRCERKGARLMPYSP